MTVNVNNQIIIADPGTIEVNGEKGEEKQALISHAGSPVTWEPIVNKVNGGTGISVDSGGQGTVTIGNTGVLSLSAGKNISLSGTTGNITITAKDQSGGGGGGGGSTTTIYDLEAGDGINLSSNTNVSSGKVKVKLAETGCAKQGSMWGSRLTLRQDGSREDPCIAMGSGNGRFVGIFNATADRRLGIMAGRDWNDSDSRCGGAPAGEKRIMFILQGGKKKDNISETDDRKVRIIPLFTTGANPNMRFNEDITNEGEEGGNYGIIEFKPKTRLAQSIDIDHATDSYQVQSLISDPETTLANLLTTSAGFGDHIHIKKHDMSANPRLDPEDPIANVPRFFYDLDAIAAVHPLLVNYEFTRESFDYLPFSTSDDSTEDAVRKPFSECSIQPVEINTEAITLLTALATKFQKARIENLETGYAKLDGSTIPGPFEDDTEAGAANVAVGGIYKQNAGTINWRVA